MKNGAVSRQVEVTHRNNATVVFIGFMRLGHEEIHMRMRNTHVVHSEANRGGIGRGALPRVTFTVISPMQYRWN